MSRLYRNRELWATLSFTLAAIWLAAGTAPFWLSWLTSVLVTPSWKPALWFTVPFAVSLTSGITLLPHWTLGKRTAYALFIANQVCAALFLLYGLGCVFLTMILTTYATLLIAALGFSFMSCYLLIGTTFWTLAHPVPKPDSCTRCGYDATGLTTCPECGTTLEPAPQEDSEP
ncbi:MAG: hypothetical protein AAGH71_06215 [Planctomycetota bacterium]